MTLFPISLEFSFDSSSAFCKQWLLTCKIGKFKFGEFQKQNFSICKSWIWQVWLNYRLVKVKFGKFGCKFGQTHEWQLANLANKAHFMYKNRYFYVYNNLVYLGQICQIHKICSILAKLALRKSQHKKAIWQMWVLAIIEKNRQVLAFTKFMCKLQISKIHSQLFLLKSSAKLVCTSKTNTSNLANLVSTVRVAIAYKKVFCRFL